MKEVLSQSHLKKAHSGQLTLQSSGALLPNEMHAEITSGMSITCEEAPFTLLRVRRKYPCTELDRYSVSTLYFAVLFLSWGSFVNDGICSSFVCTWNSTGFLFPFKRKRRIYFAGQSGKQQIPSKQSFLQQREVLQRFLQH